MTHAEEIKQLKRNLEILKQELNFREQIIEDLETNINRFEVKCTICLEYMSNPCTISCGHTFCYYCLYNWDIIDHFIKIKSSDEEMCTEKKENSRIYLICLTLIKLYMLVMVNNCANCGQRCIIEIEDDTDIEIEETDDTDYMLDDSYESSFIDDEEINYSGQTLSEPNKEKYTSSYNDAHILYALFAMQGWRISMEDAHTAELKLLDKKGYSYFGVFDGHNPKLKVDPSGCTAIIAIVTPDNVIYVGNAGDSHAVLSDDGIAIPISDDHKPDNPGNLALLCALGDFEFKQNTNLSIENQVVTGIWDCLKSQDVVSFIRKNIAEHKDLKKACEDLMECCLSKTSEGIGTDNMTVIIVGFLHNKTETDWYTWMKSRYGVIRPEYIDNSYESDDLMTKIINFELSVNEINLMLHLFG
ncbi:7395_t:CDS:2 [Gigaspora margarita]|uniref:7395_t:CDS:1 n=1 Tax=Gigaspora margarita TaxID=4874 RepID=A0ABN7UDH9_GIGMA|nr:7395_t:CDS:2 [Gigaspora margarita]